MIWFDLFLPGLHRLNAPIPLGGTSNIFRTEALRKLRSWDPYNVTEDCDLGIRIARQDGNETGGDNTGNVLPAEGSILFFPAFIYRDETLTVGVDLKNPQKAPAVGRLKLICGDFEHVLAVNLKPGETHTYYLRLYIPRDGLIPPDGKLQVFDIESDGVRGEEKFLVRDVLADLTDLQAKGPVLYDKNERRVLLVNHRERDADYRRWAVVNWMLERVQKPGANVLFWSAPRLYEVLQSSNDAQGIKGRLNSVEHSGNPLAAILEMPPASLPVDMPAVICIAWGLDETAERYDGRTFGRALDAVIDRLRQHYPKLRILLVTPPPVPGSDNLTWRKIR